MKHTRTRTFKREWTFNPLWISVLLGTPRVLRFQSRSNLLFRRVPIQVFYLPPSLFTSHQIYICSVWDITPPLPPSFLNTWFEDLVYSDTQWIVLFRLTVNFRARLGGNEFSSRGKMVRLNSSTYTRLTRRQVGGNEGRRTRRCCLWIMNQTVVSGRVKAAGGETRSKDKRRW